MKQLYLLALFAFCLASCRTTTYYVVRHAEKATGSGDVALSSAGQERAQALKEMLRDKKIGTIYSTNYLRTKSTVQPLAEAIGVTIQVYDPRDTTFISRVINYGEKDREGNRVIVGHSNTVDDIVNGLIGRKLIPGDLSDSQYGDLFVVKQRGRKFILEQKRFGN